MPSHGALNGEKMGNLHQPQAGKQQHGVVQMRHGFPNACQRLLRMTPEQEKTNVEQQDGDGNENLMAVFFTNRYCMAVSYVES